MRVKTPLAATIAGLLAANALAQAPETPALRLPVGARVRLRTQAAPGDWTKGVLAGADSGSIAIVPEGTSPVGANELRLPREAVTRLEIVGGRKRQWLPGLVIGAVLGMAMGFITPVDPELCQIDASYACSRGGAVAAFGAYGAAGGAGIGALFKKDVWTPVGLDALGPPAVRASRAGVSLRAVPGGASLDLSVRF